MRRPLGDADRDQPGRIAGLRHTDTSGTGMNPAKRLTNVFTRIRAASDAECPNACRQTPRMIASITWAIRLPPRRSTHFFGWRRTCSASFASPHCSGGSRGTRGASPASSARGRRCRARATRGRPRSARWSSRCSSPRSTTRTRSTRAEAHRVGRQDDHDEEHLDHEGAEAVEHADRQRAGSGHTGPFPEAHLQREPRRGTGHREGDELHALLQHQHRPEPELAAGWPPSSRTPGAPGDRRQEEGARSQPQSALRN